MEAMLRPLPVCPSCLPHPATGLPQGGGRPQSELGGGVRRGLGRRRTPSLVSTSNGRAVWRQATSVRGVRSSKGWVAGAVFLERGTSRWISAAVPRGAGGAKAGPLSRGHALAPRGAGDPGAGRSCRGVGGATLLFGQGLRCAASRTIQERWRFQRGILQFRRVGRGGKAFAPCGSAA